MAYFIERNKLRSEYSGYEEASQSLRERLFAVVDRYSSSGSIGIGQEDFWVHGPTYKHKLKVNLNNSDYGELIINGNYAELFQTIEIFFSLVKELTFDRRVKIRRELSDSFTFSGSVYEFTQEGEVRLKIDEGLANSLKETEEIFCEEKLRNNFFATVGDFLSRKIKAKRLVNDLWIVFEEFIKAITKERSTEKAMNTLVEKKLLNKIQLETAKKLYGYRSDALGVVHAGNTEEPTEKDALWFLESLSSLIKLIERNRNK